MSNNIQQSIQDVVQTIMQNTVSGKIDKTVAAEVLQKIIKLGNTKQIQDIAIIGISVKMPGAEDKNEFWENIRNGVNSVGDYPESRHRDSKNFVLHYSNLKEKDINYSRGGYLENIDKFDNKFFRLSPNEANLMDPAQRLFLETAWGAVEDAGYGGEKLKGSKTGVYLGYTGWPMYGHYISQTCPTMASISVPGNVSSIVASRIAYILDLKGPSILVDTACSSSLVAVHLACQGIKNNECDQAIVGGVKINLAPAEGVLSIGIESSEGITRTFDENSDGTVWGEGVAAIMLKPLKRAIEDGDDIYAVIKGNFINQDGTSVGITAPNALAQEEVLLGAWKESGIEPETITYIEAHGTGTKLGDPIEVRGIEKAFRRFTNKKQFCAIGSLKTNIGHLDGAAGISSLIKAALALKHKEIPPTLHFNIPNRSINFEQSPVYINDKLVKWETEGVARRCGVSSFGFSGTNCHIVLEEAQNIEDGISLDEKGFHIFTLSAKSLEVLKELIARYAGFVRKQQKLNLGAVCFTANTGRGHYSHRLVMIVKSGKDFKDKIEKLNSLGIEDIKDSSIYYGQNKSIPAGKGKEIRDGEIREAHILEYNDQAKKIIKEFVLSAQENEEMLHELCRLYIRGVDINWDELYERKQPKRVSIPGYPFERNRCWLDAPAGTSVELEKNGVYWMSVFENGIPKLEIPTDYPRIDSSFEADRICLTLPKNLTESLKKVADEAEVDISTLLLAAYSVLMYKSTGQEAIVIGYSGKEVLGGEGNACTLPIMSRPGGNKAFTELLDEVMDAGLKAFEHHKCSFGVLIEKLNAKHKYDMKSLFETTFIFSNRGENKSDDSGAGQPYDITLEALERECSIELVISYNTRLFEKDTADRIMNDYNSILNAVAENRSVKISDIELLREFSELENVLCSDIDFSF
ncbi:MAG: condensation domain-containing protein [Clostridia bacterium]|nr:condensation domain-containing protein [Clostridia bacterium]